MMSIAQIDTALMIEEWHMDTDNSLARIFDARGQKSKLPPLT